MIAPRQSSSRCIIGTRRNMLPDQWHCHQLQGLQTAHSFWSLQDDGQDTFMHNAGAWVNTYEWYVLLGQGGPGKADDPLKWWKVSSLYFVFFVPTWTPTRITSATFRSFLAWLETSWPFLAQVSQLSDFFPSLGTFVWTYKARSRRRQLPRPCVRGSGCTMDCTSSYDSRYVVLADSRLFWFRIFNIIS